MTDPADEPQFAPDALMLPMPEPWLDLYSRLNHHAAAILQQRHWGEPIKEADACKQDDALAALGSSARQIAADLAVAARKALPVPTEFEPWLRTVCFQKPTPEAYDLAKCAWEHARKVLSDRQAGGAS